MWTIEDGVTSVISILKVEPEEKEGLFKRLGASKDFIIFDNQYFINQFFDVLKEDFNKLVMISMVVVFLILLLFFGRIEIALITFIPIMISWLWTLGLMGLFKIEINIFNIIISTFIFGLGIDYCIFIMNGIIANYREGEHQPDSLQAIDPAFGPDNHCGYRGTDFCPASRPEIHCRCLHLRNLNRGSDLLYPLTPAV